MENIEQNTTMIINKNKTMQNRENLLLVYLVVLFFFISISVQAERRHSSTKKPIWNIAHMVNSIREINYNLRRGANSIETDVVFATNGTPIETYHGPPCDCLRLCNQREDFVDYLKYLSLITDPNETELYQRNLTLVLIDLKLAPLTQRAKADAGKRLAQLILDHIYGIEQFDYQTNDYGNDNSSNNVNNAQRSYSVSMVHSGYSIDNARNCTASNMNNGKNINKARSINNVRQRARALNKAHTNIDSSKSNENSAMNSRSNIENNSERVSDIYMVISIHHVTDVDLVLNFMAYLDEAKKSNLHRAQFAAQHIGWDVGMNDNIKKIEAMWLRYFHGDPTINIWQGDGFTNCISPFYNLARLTQALKKRDQFDIRGPGYMSKVYQWTIDLHERLREALLLGTDAIITNHPERLIKILDEPEFKNSLRLATRDDNPFERAITKRFGLSNEISELETTDSVTSGHSLVSNSHDSTKHYREGLSGTMNDLLGSVFSYFRDVIYLGYNANPLIRNVGRLSGAVSKRNKKTSAESNSDSVSEIIGRQSNEKLLSTKPSWLSTFDTVPGQTRQTGNTTDSNKAADELSGNTNWMGYVAEFLGKVILIVVQDTIDDIIETAHKMPITANSTPTYNYNFSIDDQPIYHIHVKAHRR